MGANLSSSSEYSQRLNRQKPDALTSFTISDAEIAKLQYKNNGGGGGFSKTGGKYSTKYGSGGGAGSGGGGFGGGGGAANIFTATEVHREIAHKNLKLALTHPTIVRTFRSWLKTSLCNHELSNALDFYLSSVHLRRTHKEGSSLEAAAMFYEIVKRHLSHKADLPVVIKSHHKRVMLSCCDDVVMGNKSSTAVNTPTESEHERSGRSIVDTEADSDGHNFSGSNNNSRHADDSGNGSGSSHQLKHLSSTIGIWIQALRLCEYEIFFVLRETAWLPFCDSPEYSAMILRKEVRMMITLFSTAEGNSTIRSSSSDEASSYSYMSISAYSSSMYSNR